MALNFDAFGVIATFTLGVVTIGEYRRARRLKNDHVEVEWTVMITALLGALGGLAVNLFLITPHIDEITLWPVLPELLIINFVIGIIASSVTCMASTGEFGGGIYGFWASILLAFWLVGGLVIYVL